MKSKDEVTCILDAYHCVRRNSGMLAGIRDDRKLRDFADEIAEDYFGDECLLHDDMSAPWLVVARFDSAESWDGEIMSTLCFAITIHDGDPKSALKEALLEINWRQNARACTP